MRVGLTFDLRDEYLALGYTEDEVAEFDSNDTIDQLESALGRLGFETDRIGHIRSLAKRLTAGERWDFVFNIAEGLEGRSREAQVPALLEAFGVPYTFSDPLVLALTLDKAMAKRVARDQGVVTTPFFVVRDEADIARVDLPYPVFAKPLAEGTGKGVDGRSKVKAESDLAPICRDLLTRFRQPVIVEPFLSGREFTVGITGTGDEAEIIAVLEVVLLENAEADVYSYVNKEECESRIHYRLAHDEEAKQAGETALAAYRALECRDAGRVDLRSDAKGVPHFMEVNPLAGLHPSHSDLPILAGLAGMSYDALISRIVESCLKRHHLESKPAARKRAAS